MTKIEKFEEVEAWQMARKLTKEIYHLSRHGTIASDFGLKDQIRRSALSVMSNIAEGFSRGGNREFIQFLFIAKASTTELQSQLYAALDAEYITQTQFREVYDLAASTSRLIGGFIRYLKSSNYQISSRNSKSST